MTNGQPFCHFDRREKFLLLTATEDRSYESSIDLSIVFRKF
jgi:hypothetical protein